MKSGNKKISRKKHGKPERRKISPDKKEAIISRLKEIAEPLCEAEELKLVKVDYIENAYGTIIQIFIDKPGGITIEDCSNFSMKISDLLDVKLVIDTSYRLEVSSPGI